MHTSQHNHRKVAQQHKQHRIAVLKCNSDKTVVKRLKEKHSRLIESKKYVEQLILAMDNTDLLLSAVSKPL